MARTTQTDENGRRYYVVEAGDTLIAIAVDFFNDDEKYKQLAAINGLEDPNYLYIGQKIYLEKGDFEGSASANPVSNKPAIDKFGLLSSDESERTLFATWTWYKTHTESYKVLWTYDTGDGVWLVGTNSTISVDKDAPATARQSTYSIPTGARRVQFRVKPISEKYKKNDVDTTYWEAEWSDTQTYTDETRLETPGVPNVTLEEYKLTASLDNINVVFPDDKGSKNQPGIEFQVVVNHKTVFKSAKASIWNKHAQYSCYVSAGNEYKVRCRAVYGTLISDWSEYSGNYSSMPKAPGKITTIRAEDESSVYLEWGVSATATGYEIEYATDRNHFDITDQTTTKTIDKKTTTFVVSGLEPGYEYFFRVRATKDQEKSEWTAIRSTLLGQVPAAPTTWSSSTKVVAGEIVKLYWVHNSEDNSKQTAYNLEYWINDQKYVVNKETPPEEDDELDKTHFVEIRTIEYAFQGGATIRWKVQTAGVTEEFGPFSIERTIEIYAPPTITLEVVEPIGLAPIPDGLIKSFPFCLSGVTAPTTQMPISYHVSVIANEAYETTDSVGNLKMVNVGDEIYSKHIDRTNYVDGEYVLNLEFSASNIDLHNHVGYTIKCVAAMNSGLTAEGSTTINVEWADPEYIPNAEIGIDEDTISAYIRPYCENAKMVRYKVERQFNQLKYEYTKTDTAVTGVWGINSVAYTTTGEMVYDGVTSDGDQIYFCEVEERTPVDNASMAVYRREFDGSFTEIASGLDSSRATTVTDPHPSLDRARYRIVATDKDTGAISFYDMPGYPVGGKAAIIQWDEAWSEFDVSEDEALEEPVWSGSMLKIPYNIDVSENAKPDVVLVEYLGRSHPVGYYGTQVGQSSSWNMEIPKTDKDTLYALRRLQRWMGDVYVREPSGSGYWANVTVSFSQKHCDVTIPISLSITRVEGGV